MASLRPPYMAALWCGALRAAPQRYIRNPLPVLWGEGRARGNRRNPTFCHSRALLHRNQALAQRIDRRLSAVRKVQLAKDIADVGLDGLLADDQRVGDLLVALALGDQTQHVHLAL